MKHAVIYVPGLGDRNPRGQRLLVRTWHLWGVQPELFQMNWADGEAFEAKFERLLSRIDTLVKAGKKVSIVGASAGGGAVINAFAARKNVLSGVVCICGKINHPGAIGGNYRSKNSAFVDSAYMVPSSLERLDMAHDRLRILSRYASFDPIVPRRDSIVPGAHNRMVGTMGHAFTIATQLLFGAPSFLRFLKRTAK